MAIKGAIIGDIVGSRFEFEDVKGLDWMNCELFSEKCDFTDDTVMTLAIKSAIDKGVDFQTEMRSVGRRYPLCGYGGRFLEWMLSDDPKPYGSYGNGSAMRVSYIGDYYDDLQEAVAAAKESAIVSHDHPEGIKLLSEM